MPELPDIHYFAYVINQLFNDGVSFNSIRAVSTWSRAGVNDALLKSLPSSAWRIIAMPRGKEMILRITAGSESIDPRSPSSSSSSSTTTPSSSSHECEEEHHPSSKRFRCTHVEAAVSCAACQGSTSTSAPTSSASAQETSFFTRVAFGLSGYFAWTPSGADPPKHAHIEFVAEKGGSLFYADVRRLGSFKWGIDAADLWGDGRGPDPMTEYAPFVANIRDRFAAYAKKKSLVIAEALLDQALFNGIGNYMRCEILHRVGLGPFIPYCEAILACEPHPSDAQTVTEDNTLLKACHSLSQEVYQIRLEEARLAQTSASYGGAQLFEDWLQVYNKKSPVNSAELKGRQIFWLGERLAKPNHK